MTIIDVPHWKSKLSREALNVITTLEKAGVATYVIGGTPRNLWWGVPPNDLDIECFGVSASDLLTLLKSMGRVKTVGQDFGIYDLITHGGLEVQVAMPRRERQIGISSKDIEVVADPYMLPEEAAYRRDYWINAGMWRVVQDTFLVFGMTQYDLDNKILRPCGPAFEEDALRPLRGFRLAAEYNLKIADWDMAMFARMADRFHTIPKARLRQEWEKWAKSMYPAQGLRVLEAYGWLKCFPVLNGLNQVEHDPIWHREGNPWKHTIEVMEALQHLRSNPMNSDLDWPTMNYSGLLHDVGKAVTTVLAEEGPNKGRWVSPGHDTAGVPLAKEFFAQMYDATNAPWQNQVYALIKCHMRHINFQGGDGAIRRLANEVGNIYMLSALVAADHSGRPFMGEMIFPEMMTMIENRAIALRVYDKPPQQLIMGRHLLDRGWKPGQEMGKALRFAFKKQLSDEPPFHDLESALIWFDQGGWKEMYEEEDNGHST